MRVRGRAVVAGDGLGEADLVGFRHAQGRPTDVEALLRELPRRLGLAAGPAWERGDLLVAGGGIGLGVRTDWPAWILHRAGFGAVLAEGVLPAFRDSLLHIGLPLLVLPGLRRGVRPWDDLIVNLETGAVENVSTHRVLVGRGLTPSELRIVHEAPTRRLLPESGPPVPAQSAAESLAEPPAP